MIHNLNSLGQFRPTKLSFFKHNTTPYMHLRLDSRIGPRFSAGSLGRVLLVALEPVRLIVYERKHLLPVPVQVILVRC